MQFYQTWPTEAEMAEADEINKTKTLKKKVLPRGTSEYQVFVQPDGYYLLNLSFGALTLE